MHMHYWYKTKCCVKTRKTHRNATYQDGTLSVPLNCLLSGPTRRAARALMSCYGFATPPRTAKSTPPTSPLSDSRYATRCKFKPSTILV